MKTFNETFSGIKSVVRADEQFDTHYQSFMYGEAPRYTKAIEFAEKLFDSCNQLELYQVTVAMAEALMYYKQKLEAEKA